MKHLLLFLAMSSVSFLSSCEPAPNPQEIVDRALQAHQAQRLENATLHFTFRGAKYELMRQGKTFRYTKIVQDSAGITHDILTNDGFRREINGKHFELADDKKQSAYSSLNSVAYFVFLPLGLNDAAVQKNYEGIRTIKGKQYHKIKITFQEEGGGDDFEDEFYYWFNAETFTMDYMAYLYHTNGGGIRFREVAKTHRVSGVLLQDYLNFKPKSKEMRFADIDEAFEKGELELLSRIEITDLSVK